MDLTSRERPEMGQAVQNEVLNEVQFLENGNGEILQVIPLSAGRFLVAGVKGFGELRYSLEGPVPFSGDPRLAFNRIPETDPPVSNNGFRLIGKEFNRIARLSGTNDPEIVRTFRSHLHKNGELVTFLIPEYRDSGRVNTVDSLVDSRPARQVPSRTCLAVVEIRCWRDFDYMPSRSTHFFFYYRDRLRIVEHTVYVGPQHDCPGEEWEACAYESALGNGVCGFFEHHDGAVSIELRTQPRGLLLAAGSDPAESQGNLKDANLKFAPLMIDSFYPPLAFSPPEIPDREYKEHLVRFRQHLVFLHEAITSAVSKQTVYGG